MVVVPRFLPCIAHVFVWAGSGWWVVGSRCISYYPVSTTYYQFSRKTNNPKISNNQCNEREWQAKAQMFPESQWVTQFTGSFHNN